MKDFYFYLEWEDFLVCKSLSLRVLFISNERRFLEKFYVFFGDRDFIVIFEFDNLVF